MMTKKGWITRKKKYGNCGYRYPKRKSEIQREKMKGRDNSSWIQKSIETRMKRIKEGKIRYDGEYARNWQGGKTKEHNLRMTKEYKELRLKVFERDDYTCQHCKNRGGVIEAHHIKSFAYHPELRLTIENIITLCKNCHKKTDSFGNKVHKNKEKINSTTYNH